jgi:hypothetical protein
MHGVAHNGASERNHRRDGSYMTLEWYGTDIRLPSRCLINQPGICDRSTGQWEGVADLLRRTRK